MCFTCEKIIYKFSSIGCYISVTYIIHTLSKSKRFTNIIYLVYDLRFIVINVLLTLYS